MTDKELLEKAAKAAGIDALYWNDGNEPYSSGQGIICGDNHIWNPLNSDGDALRLAVKLNLDIEFLAEPDGVEVWVCATWSDDPVSQTEEGGKDLLAATRRAIVRAAAAIVETT